jgi:hypothetical protein
MADQQESRGLGKDPKLLQLRLVVGSIVAKSVKTLKAIVLLCDHGWTADAVVLLRGLFESWVTVAFLCRRKPWATYLYVEDSILSSERRAREMPELGRAAGRAPAGDSGVEQRSEQETRKARAWLKAVYGGPAKTEPTLWKNGRRRYWRNWTVRDKCEAVGLSAFYPTLYRWASCEAHAGVESLRWHSKECANGPIFQAVPTDENLVRYLGPSVVCFLGVLFSFDDAFKLGCKARIQAAFNGQVRSLTGQGGP